MEIKNAPPIHPDLADKDPIGTLLIDFAPMVSKMIEQAKQETAAAIFKEIDYISHPMNTNMQGINLSKVQWKSLKSKYIKGEDKC